MAARRERTRARYIAEKWSDITEIIGPANQWPFNIRRLFWTPNLHHFERILVAAFCYVNGLNPVICLEWAVLLHLCRNWSSFNHLRALFKLFFRLFRSGRNYTLYAWQVSFRRYEYLDGRVRRYQPRHQRN